MYPARSSSLAFFSEKKINTLSELLGNDTLRRLVEAMEAIIKTRLLARGGLGSTMTPVSFMKPSRIEEVPRDIAASYVDGSFSLIRLRTFILIRTLKLTSRTCTLCTPSSTNETSEIEHWGRILGSY